MKMVEYRVRFASFSADSLPPEEVVRDTIKSAIADGDYGNDVTVGVELAGEYMVSGESDKKRKTAPEEGAQ